MQYIMQSKGCVCGANVDAIASSSDNIVVLEVT